MGGCPELRTEFADPVRRERAAGRLWRARDLLRGRLGQSDYDRALFRLLADVLADMHDDDEAGRYYFLSGERDGRAGILSKAFLDRRTRRKLHLFWGDMPRVASRVTSGSIPDVCRTDLEATGHTAPAVRQLLDGLVEAEHQRQRNRLARQNRVATPMTWRQRVQVAAVILVLGLCIVAFLKGAGLILEATWTWLFRR